MAEHYDVVVVGSAPAAVATAALTAKQGHRVLLALTPEAEGDAAGDDLTGQGTRPPQLGRVLQALDACDGLHARRDKQASRLQLLCAHRRIEVPYDAQDVLAALQGAWPDIARALQHFFGRLKAHVAAIDRILAPCPPLPAAGFLGRLWPVPRALRRYLAPFDARQEHALFADVPAEHPARRALLWSSFPVDLAPASGPQAQLAAPSTLAVVRGLWDTFFAAATSTGHGGHWRTQLLQSGERCGMRALPAEGGVQLLSRGRRADGLRLARGPQGQGDEVRARWIVGDVCTPGLAAAHQDQHPPLPAAGWPCWQIDVPPRRLPASLGLRAWALDDAAASLDRPWCVAAAGNAPAGPAGPVRLHRRAAAAHRAPAPAHDTLLATWFAQPRGRGPAGLAAARAPAGGPTDSWRADVAALLTRLRYVLPFIDAGAVQARPHRRIGVALRARAGAHANGSATRYRNVLHCDTAPWPELGLEGAMMAATGLATLLGRCLRRA